MTQALRLPNLNLVLLVGRLVADPEVRYTPSGQAVMNMRLAHTRRYQVGGEWREESLFINAVLWGANAERLQGRLIKGTPVLVEGRLRYREWETEEGLRRNVIEIHAFRVQPLDKLPQEPEEGEAVPERELPELDEESPTEDLPF